MATQWKVFVSTGTPGGGQESTVICSPSTLVHHGMIFVPLGYKLIFAQLANVAEVCGGGSLQSPVLELEVAKLQGAGFWETVSQYKF
ncbi:hypothetical protein BU15DRAFT_74016 [Melanogaster broomeanus]|nr:hypothetical protein BU15DRAFT_74016 [Melanogaster broomeanus]